MWAPLLKTKSSWDFCFSSSLIILNNQKRHRLDFCTPKILSDKHLDLAFGLRIRRVNSTEEAEILLQVKKTTTKKNLINVANEGIQKKKKRRQFTEEPKVRTLHWGEQHSWLTITKKILTMSKQSDLNSSFSLFRKKFRISSFQWPFCIFSTTIN